MYSKKGATTLMMSMGILICIAVLIIGSIGLIGAAIKQQIEADPRSTVTDLTSIINLIHAAPDTVEYTYYTSTDETGYPVIGALEIDDDKQELCISQHSEQEMYENVLNNAGQVAGAEFLTVGVVKARQAYKGWANERAVKPFNTEFPAELQGTSDVDVVTYDLSARLRGKGEGGNMYNLESQRAGHMLFDSGKTGTATRSLVNSKVDLRSYGMDKIVDKSKTWKGRHQLRKLDSMMKKQVDSDKLFAYANKIGLNIDELDDVVTQFDNMNKPLKKQLFGKRLQLGQGMAGDLDLKGVRDTLEGAQALSMNVPTKRKLFETMGDGSGTLGQRMRRWVKTKVPFSKARADYKHAKAVKMYGADAAKLSKLDKAIIWLSKRQSRVGKAIAAPMKRLLSGARGIKTGITKVLDKVMNKLAGKFADKFIKKYMQTWFGKVILKAAVPSLGKKVVIAEIEGKLQIVEAKEGEVAVGSPEPVTKGTLLSAALVKHFITVAISVVDTTIDLIVTDVMIHGVSEAGKDAAKRERETVYCGSFNTQSAKVLLYPANCQPYYRFQSPVDMLPWECGFTSSTRKTASGKTETVVYQNMVDICNDKWNKFVGTKPTDNPGEAKSGGFDAQTNFWQPISDAWNQVWGSFSGLADMFKSWVDEGIGKFLSDLFSGKFFAELFISIGKFFWNLFQALMAVLGGALGWLGEITGFSQVMQNLLDNFVPRPDCYEDFGVEHKATGVWSDPVVSTGCDQEVISQDCPNMFVSASGEHWLASSGGAVMVLLQGGPACAVASIGGSTGTWCNIIRYGAAIGIYFSNPGGVMQYFTHVSDIGLTKKVDAKTVDGERLTAGNAGRLKNQYLFADNEGYWYAEYPSVISIKKAHYNEDNGEERYNIIISKE